MPGSHSVILESLTLQSDLKGVVLAVASILQIDRRVAVEKVKSLPLLLAADCTPTQAQLMGDMLRGMGAGVRVSPPLPEVAPQVEEMPEPVPGPLEEVVEAPVEEAPSFPVVHAKPKRPWRTWVVLFFVLILGGLGLWQGWQYLAFKLKPSPERSMQLLQKGKMKEAGSSLKKQLSSQPDNVDLLVTQGMYYIGLARQRMAQEGWAGYGEGTQVPKTQTDLLRVPEADSAVAVLLRAGTLAPRRGDVQRLLSLAYQQKGLSSEAEMAARRAVELAPGDVDNWNQLGVVLVELEQYGQAEQVFYAALKADAQNAITIKNLGVLNLYHNRDTLRAAAFLSRYLASSEGERDLDRLLLRKDLARVMLGQYNMPLASLLPDSMPFPVYELRRKRLSALSGGERDAAVQEELGVLYASRGMDEVAQASLVRAVSLRPEAESAWKLLAVLQMREGNFDKTLRTLRSAVRAGAQEPFFYRNIGVLEKYYRFDQEAARQAWELYLGQAGDSWVGRVRSELGTEQP